MSMKDPPEFSTIRLNSADMSLDDLMEIIKPQIVKDFSRKGVNQVFMWTHHAVKDVCVIKNIINKQTVHQTTLNIAVVDCACGSAVLRGAHIFGVGVLCLSPGTEKGDIINVYADLNGKCLKGSKSYNGDLFFLGTAEVHMTREDLFGANRSHSGVALEMRTPICVAPSLELPTTQGFPQNLPSAVASHVLEVAPSLRVLDMCAAPGGKTSHLAMLMRGQGELIALDKSKSRVKKMRTFFDQCDHCKFIKSFATDSSKCCSKDKLEFDSCLPFPAACFDRILLDAPCSALGQRPQLIPAEKTKCLESYPPLQRSLMSTAFELLKPGGILVYCTCTTTAAENEELVLWTLRTFPELRLSPQQISLRPLLIEGTDVPVQKFDPGAALDGVSAPEDIDTIGFFIAKFEKIFTS